MQLTIAQNITLKGALRDKTDSSALRNATIRLTSPEDAGFRKQVLTNTAGAFQIPDLKPAPYIITITYIGYGELTRAIMLQVETQDLGTIYMPKSSRDLQEVVIKGQVPAAQQKGDTLQYNADAYKTNPDASGEDLVRKMPGIVVENGTVKAHGEDVKRVLLDGKEFFGEDATLALRNLPAEMISKIEVFDRQSDQAQFTGFDDGNSQKTINVVTRAEMRSGQFGKIFAGYGTDGRYNAGGSVNLFSGDRRISLIGLSNNINQQNFSQQDLLGVMNAGSSRGGRGGRGGGRGGFGGGGGNFMVGQQDGINKTNSFGVNYSDEWGKKVSVTGSYFFNNSNNSNEEFTNTQTVRDDGTSQYNAEEQRSSSNNYNHRLNMRVEYKIDSSNTIIFTPGISFQNNRSSSNSFTTISPDGFGINPISSSENIRSATSSGYNLNGNLMYRHAFAKRGRTVSLSVGFGANDRDGETFNRNYITDIKNGNLADTVNQQILPFSDGHNLNANIAYTEPVGKQGQLQFNYSPSVSKSNSDRKTFDYDTDIDKYALMDTSQSSLFNNTYTAQNAGVSYRIGNRDKMLAFGVSYQHSTLASDALFPQPAQVRQSFSNILPNAMLMMKAGEYGRLRVFYRTNTNNPSIQQLQNVLNVGNSINVSMGNPELDQSFGHTLATRYNYTNTQSGHNFFANVFFSSTQDYVTNAIYFAKSDTVLTPTFTLLEGGQISKPVNLDGYWSIRSFFTYGVPLKFIKSNFNANAGVGFTQTPNMIDEVTSLTGNYNYNLGAVISSNISEYVDFTVNYSANFNTVKDPTALESTTKYFSHTAGVSFNLLSKNGWVMQQELNNQLYSGLSEGNNQNYFLWNASVGKKFLKNQRGELRLSGFDLLKQNRSISRIQNGKVTTDVRSQVLTQYFMLTFTYKLRNFGKANTNSRDGGEERRWERPGGPPGGMMRRPF
ncbi:TonB-dependent receptor [Chitinophaga sp. XS-30]|uniref:TonB-dependent receptor n=1 Tax=Chitinophaga sp. XS-30 TaxID=2604421 RepID=UPI00143CDF94|nr:TonB-dependent receptor [Chitinophaga sp. XS-30]